MYPRLGNPVRESDSERNNTQPDNKQKPKITNKNTGKITCQYGQLVSVRCFETYCMSCVLPTFSGVLVNATVLTLLLKSFAGKKFQSRRFS